MAEFWCNLRWQQLLDFLMDNVIKPVLDAINKLINVNKENAKQSIFVLNKF